MAPWTLTIGPALQPQRRESTSRSRYEHQMAVIARKPDRSIALRQLTAAQVPWVSADCPDEVYLVSILSSRWFITRLRIDDKTLYDLPVDERHWKMHGSALVNVTGEKRMPRT
jgi:hypothetical protein